MKYFEAVADRLKYFMCQKGVYPSMLANSAGIAPDVLKEILCGQCGGIALGDLCKICRALDVSLSDVLPRSD